MCGNAIQIYVIFSLIWELTQIISAWGNNRKRHHGNVVNNDGFRWRHQCLFSFETEKLLVTANAGLYHFINQGCLTVDAINDPEEYAIVDVCLRSTLLYHTLKADFYEYSLLICSLLLVMSSSLRANIWLIINDDCWYLPGWPPRKTIQGWTKLSRILLPSSLSCRTKLS